MDILGFVEDSANQYVISSEKEAISLAWTSLFINKYLNNEQISVGNLEKQLNDDGNPVTMYSDSDGNYIATFVNTNNIYKIGSNGNAEKIN